MASGGKEATSRGIAAVALGGLVVSVAAMLIVPLPTWLIDLLITLNLGASVTLLLGAAYARTPLSIATFPTLLVLSTLFRLALNVSTVRLILLQADAGQVVSAFGQFVVRGDYVVGGAVFLILTVVQYVVIARGAERVAEVAARFTLDAMPGKQLAIDADLRSRAIDAGEARRRRETLQREAQLYGSLDGAMRFVKGDAVAALLILGISLVGGLAIGVLRRNMAIGDAARVYTLLTIGDGLASQIPALLLATAAGLLVTRVSAEDESASLGDEALRQFLGRPQILFSVAALLGVLAILPGLPLLPFAAIALIFAVAAIGLLRRTRAAGPPAGAPHLPKIGAPLELVLPSKSAALPGLGTAVDGALAALVDDLGVSVPALRVTEGAAASLRLHGSPIALEGAPLDTPESIAAAVVRALRRNAAALVGLDETERMLESLSLRCPALVREVIPRRLDVAALAEVVRRLVAEGVGVGDLREVLEAIARGPLPQEGEARDPIAIAERVRRALAPRLSARLAPGGRLEALLLDPLMEEAVREAVRPGATLALEPAIADELLDALTAHAAAPALLVAAELRPHLARLAAAARPDLRVVAFEELAPEVEVIELGRVGAAPLLAAAASHL